MSNKILKYISVDTNILDYCIDNNIASSEFNDLLKKNGYVPLLVPYVIYECAKCFVDKNHEKIAKKETIERGKKLFCYIKELNPFYSCKRDYLYKMECDKIKYDREVNCLAGVLLSDIIQKRIDELCLGYLSEDLKKFILSHVL